VETVNPGMPATLDGASRRARRETRIASCAVAMLLAHHYRISPP